MKRKPANKKSDKRKFSKTAAKTHRKNQYAPRAGYRL